MAIRKIHDLVALQACLDAQDAAVVSSDDIDVLTPWNIAGRYPADLDDADRYYRLTPPPEYRQQRNHLAWLAFVPLSILSPSTEPLELAEGG